MKNVKLYCLLLGWLLSSCYKDKDYLPTNINANDVIISLSATPSTISADGASFTFLTAELPLDAVDSKSNVVFTTTKGVFDNNSKTITFAATVVNDSGTNRRLAKVKLTSSTVIENADVTATVGSVSKVLSVSFTNLPFDTFLTVNASAASIPADGVSFTYINVEQPINILNDYTSITFTATSGSFDNGTKTITKPSATVLSGAEYKRLAQVRLTTSKTEENVSVEVAIKGTFKTIPINFVKAYPESVKIAVSAPAIATGFGNSLSITVSLLRTTGTPSINNTSNLSVVDTNGVNRGSFINYTTNSDITGAIVNKYTLGNDTYKGPLTITATSADATGKTIMDHVQITAQ
jgi:hypothetical protein